MTWQVCTCNGDGGMHIDPQDFRAAHRIIRQVAAYRGVAPECILSRDKAKRTVEARDVAVRRLRDELNLTARAIGIILGGRDHSTILHSLYKTENAA